jgi:inner membrane protein
LAHSLVGLAVVKSGLERLSPAAVPAAIIAANAADIDVLAGFRGRWFALEHHRGITHSIVGTLLLPVIITSVFMLGDLVWAKFGSRPTVLSFRGLLLITFLAGCTHPVLDWTNNYGVRPFLPWSNKWYYGDLVFIVDPWIWMFVGGGVFLAASYTKFQKTAWAILGTALSLALFLFVRRSQPAHGIVILGVWFFTLAALLIFRVVWSSGNLQVIAPRLALLILVGYWCSLAGAHALAQKRSGEFLKPQLSGEERLVKSASMPAFADPTSWTGIAETDRAFYRFPQSLLRSGPEASGLMKIPKPVGEAREMVDHAAKSSPAVHAFLRFSRFPAVLVTGDCTTGINVQFGDLRFGMPRRGAGGTFAVGVVNPCAEQ